MAPMPDAAPRKRASHKLALYWLLFPGVAATREGPQFLDAKYVLKLKTGDEAYTYQMQKGSGVAFAWIATPKNAPGKRASCGDSTGVLCEARDGRGLPPQTIVDYIVVHEVCHPNHRDHTDAFWNEVDKVMPDFRERKERLRKNGAGLDV